MNRDLDIGLGPHLDLDGRDPFAALDAARQPSADGRGASSAPPAAGPGVWRDAEPLSFDARPDAGLEPLIAAAQPLLAAAPRLRQSARQEDPAALKSALADGLRRFEQTAARLGVTRDRVLAARYVLCTVLDEAAASTPWGGNGVWAGNNLLVQFHDETWGGEKVFRLMQKLATDVAANRDLLQLMYLALALGFEGRYRVADQGAAQVRHLRHRIHELLTSRAEAVPTALSPVGVPRAEAGNAASRLRDGVSVWLVAAVTVAVLALSFGGLRLALSDRTQPVFATLAALDAPALARAAPPAAEAPRLAGFLQPEIAAGLVTVTDLADRSVIVMTGDRFFDAGSASLDPSLRPLLTRIAEALRPLPGQVLITGHTDSAPIRTARFPSNWHLSQARAESVRDGLAERVPATRLRAEGRAEAEPVADNATPAGRARNRRVVITLWVKQPTP
ncbi:type VI secretion system protein TssL, long form [Mitsuaria sp. CC2]|uniref:type VI secretion system protein TssL, long form n=1 Tax=Mitsuaria sp. CC2 TaxID=3029186 RepID=UPI003B8B6710